MTFDNTGSSIVEFAVRDKQALGKLQIAANILLSRYTCMDVVGGDISDFTAHYSRLFKKSFCSVFTVLLGNYCPANNIAVIDVSICLCPEE